MFLLVSGLLFKNAFRLCTVHTAEPYMTSAINGSSLFVIFIRVLDNNFVSFYLFLFTDFENIS